MSSGRRGARGNEVEAFRCENCQVVWREDITAAAEPRGKLTRAAVRWVLEAAVCQHLPVARVAESLDVSWHAVNDAVLTEGQRALIDVSSRFDRVATIGVDEYVWRYTRFGDKYVTIIIDLIPVREKTGPSRLLDMVPGRSKHSFKTWLAGRPRPGATGSRSSRWTASPATRLPPMRRSPTRSR